jgi:hypothetical protein
VAAAAFGQPHQSLRSIASTDDAGAPGADGVHGIDAALIVTEMLQKLRCEAFFRKID